MNSHPSQLADYRDQFYAKAYFAADGTLAANYINSGFQSIFTCSIIVPETKITTIFVAINVTFSPSASRVRHQIIVDGVQYGDTFSCDVYSTTIPSLTMICFCKVSGLTQGPHSLVVEGRYVSEASLTVVPTEIMTVVSQSLIGI